MIKNFSNLQRGMDILQRTLSQLLIYYTRQGLCKLFTLALESDLLSSLET